MKNSIYLFVILLCIFTNAQTLGDFKEKITTFTTSDYDNWGTETALGTVYAAKNKSNSKVALVHTEAEKYQRGVIMAIDQFLQYHLNEFSGKYYK